MSEYPKPCGLCPSMIEGDDDLMWHGYGNCVEITDEMWAQWEREAKVPRLTDPWFEARLFCEAADNGGYRHEHVDGRVVSFSESQGVELWCPCGYGKAEFPLDGGRPHMIMVPFGNPPCGIPCPLTFGPESRDKSKPRPRWSVSGNSLENLSTQPSIAVGDPECWHGYITNGEVNP